MDKELKKLNRYQLLEILIMQTERADKLQKKVDELEARLEKRELNLSKLGSIAEAAMQINEVFEASQKAADLYLESAKKQAVDILMDARRESSLILAKAKVEARYNLDIQQESNKETGK